MELRHEALLNNAGALLDKGRRGRDGFEALCFDDMKTRMADCADRNERVKVFVEWQAAVYSDLTYVDADGETRHGLWQGKGRPTNEWLEAGGGVASQTLKNFVSVIGYGVGVGMNPCDYAGRLTISPDGLTFRVTGNGKTPYGQWKADVTAFKKAARKANENNVVPFVA